MTKIGRKIAKFLHDQTFYGRFYGFVIITIDAVISNERIRHTNHLSTVRWIGNQFLITRHSGIENHFTFGFELYAKTFAMKNFSGF